jgi:hypothetical protein
MSLVFVVILVSSVVNLILIPDISFVFVVILFVFVVILLVLFAILVSSVVNLILIPDISLVLFVYWFRQWLYLILFVILSFCYLWYISFVSG